MIIKTVDILNDELVNKINNLSENEPLILTNMDKKRIIVALQYSIAVDIILDKALNLD